MKVNVNFAIKSRKGKRPINQDRIFCTYNHDADFIGIISDGVGSIKGSEFAAQVIVNTFASEFEKTYNLEKPIIWAKLTLDKAIERIALVEKIKNAKGIAATMAMLLIVKDKYYVFNIGDTRIYGITLDKKIDLLTKDHNYYSYLVSKKTSQANLEANRDKWHALIRYVEGKKSDKAKMDYVYGDVSKYRNFLLATDGLYSYVDETTMVKKICKHLPLVFRSISLNSYAYNHGSTDNISNVLVSSKVYDK